MPSRSRWKLQMNLQDAPIPAHPIRLTILIFAGSAVIFGLGAVNNVWDPWTQILKTSAFSLLLAYCGVGFALAIRRPLAWSWFWSCILFAVVHLGVFVVGMMNLEEFMHWISVIWNVSFGAAILLLVSGIVVATLGWRDWWVEIRNTHTSGSSRVEPF